MMILNWIKCKVKGHTLEYAGQCPYTGSVYDVCTRCMMTIPRQVAV